MLASEHITVVLDTLIALLYLISSCDSAIPAVVALGTISKLIKIISNHQLQVSPQYAVR
jgi:hypothetical protein